ncbi:hypothetical protein F5888DRAFT_1799059 [Russula emetica]|nr:hypothetical protein F5888DRAFT_1799059 [Russula emetica]
MAISPSINNLVFIFHIDVVLLSLFALYVVLTLPRALVRLFQPSELLNGFFLRSGTAPPPTSLHRSGTRSRSGLTRTKPIRSTSTRTNQTGRTLIDLPEDGIASEWVKSSKAQRPALIILPRGNGNGTTRGSRSRSHQSAPSPRRGPTRVPRWTTILHPTLAYALNFRVAPGFSFGKLLVLLAYAGIMIYASLCRSNPFSDALRPGYVAISQIPIAVALAGKTNWLSWACGVGYEKLNYIHRFAGRVIIITANVHALAYLYVWSATGAIQSQLFGIPKNVWGLVALCAIDLLFVSSISFVRNRMYSLFFGLHVICVTVFLYATYRHARASLPYVLTAVGLYVFDHLARIARTRYTTGWLTAEHALNGGTTLVHVRSLRAGWRAGQHVRVRVVSNTWFGWWTTWFFCRARPFTIATGSDSSCMMLPIKAMGSWTRNLLRLAGEADDARPEPAYTDLERGRGPAREVRVIIEGPYSGPGYTLYTAYSGAVLVAGGSGISYVMSVLDDMLRKHASGMSHVRVIEVIWSVMDPDSLYSLLPELTPLMEPHASPHTSLSLRFNVHWTRVSARPPRVPRTALPSGMYIRPGRPDISDTLQSVITGVRSAYSTSRKNGGSDLISGIVIGSCGPAALMDDAARAVGRVSWADWKDVGGVESIEEAFGW